MIRLVCGLEHESAAARQHVMSGRIEEELKKIGANYVQACGGEVFAVGGENSITGQQNFSGSETAEAVTRAPGQ